MGHYTGRAFNMSGLEHGFVLTTATCIRQEDHQERVLTCIFSWKQFLLLHGGYFPAQQARYTTQRWPHKDEEADAWHHVVGYSTMTRPGCSLRKVIFPRRSQGRINAVHGEQE